MLNQPPLTDELEVTVFGPGIGESILIHCGAGEWICCDCTATEGRCWPLWYLDQLGFQASTCVRLIVTTHWHADHVRGLSSLLHACTRAQFVCSSALREDEFKQIVARYSVQEPGAAQPPLSEVRKSFALLAKRKEEDPTVYRPPVFATAHTVLDGLQIGSREVRVMALSPSAQDVLNALEAFAGYFVPVDEPATGLSPIDQNHASVVLSVQIDRDFLLLGADLERTKSLLTGWNAVGASMIRPQQPSCFFKIPHHGSAGAQLDDVWERMLVSQSHAVVTPYLSSNLPRLEGIQWLLAKSANLYATGVPHSTRVRRRNEVEKTIRESTLQISAVSLPAHPGTVRFRKLIGSPESWRVETFGQAEKLAA